MKLFTKEIDKKLAAQYHLGSDLNAQVVVAKIFNPYGNGRWYLINSDPADPDYLWAIVQIGDIVEVGSVSRKELENLRVGRLRFPLERDLGFSQRNAQEVYNGVKGGKTYANGGVADVTPTYAAGGINEEELTKFAEELQKAESEVWDNLDIRSGGQLYRTASLQKQYTTQMAQAFNEVAKKFAHLKDMNVEHAQVVHDILEDQNYHSLNNYLALKGVYGANFKKLYVGQHTQSPDNYLNPANMGRVKSYAVGGLTPGRWYKDNEGIEYKFIGKVDNGPNKDQLLFTDGTKKSYKNIDDFGEKPKENKLFGWFGDGGVLGAKYNVSFNYNPSNLSNKDAEKIASGYTKNWRHNNDFDEVSFYVLGLSKEDADMLVKELKMEDVYNIEVDKSSYAVGGELTREERKNKTYFRVSWDDGDKVNDEYFTDNKSASEKYYNLIKNGEAKVAFLDKDSFNEYGWQSKHETLSLYPKSNFADGGVIKVGDYIRIKDGMKGKLMNIEWENLEVKKITKQRFPSGMRKFYHVEYDGYTYDVRADLVDYDVMADGGQIGEDYREELQEYILDKYSDEYVYGFNLTDSMGEGESPFIWKNEDKNIDVLAIPFYEDEDEIHIEVYKDEDKQLQLTDRSYKIVGRKLEDAREYLKILTPIFKKYNNTTIPKKQKIHPAVDVEVLKKREKDMEISDEIADITDGYSFFIYKVGNGYELDFEKLLQEVKAKKIQKADLDNLMKSSGTIEWKNEVLSKFGNIMSKKEREKLEKHDGKSVYMKGGYMADGGKLKYNDPVLMAMRAKKDAAKPMVTKPNPNQAQIAMLLKKKARIEKDMEQEAELEGGPKADEYAAKLEKIDNAIKKLRANKMAMGGKTKFADKVKSIQSSLLKRKKVAPSVQKDYGKTYNKAEAKEAATRIVGAMTAKERLMAKKKK
jgi:hypothetical protein